MFKHCVIIAAGKGERMSPLTKYLPKPLILVHDKTLIDNNIDILLSENINIHVTYGYMGDKLINSIHKKVKTLINTENKDNAWFLFNSPITNIDEPILVIPSDIRFEINFELLYKNYFELSKPKCMIVGVNPIEDIDGDYITIDSSNVITRLDRSIKSDIYSSGIQVLNPNYISRFNYNENFTGLWNDLIIEKQLKLSTVQPNNWYAYDKIKQIL